MKKRYRAFIDYEVEINEKIQAPDSEGIRPEKLYKMQQIMDAFISHPEILNEYFKLRHFGFHIDLNPACITVMDFPLEENRAIWESLARQLPSETASFLLCMNGLVESNDSNPYDDRDLNVFMDHFGCFFLLDLSQEEIGDEKRGQGK